MANPGYQLPSLHLLIPGLLFLAVGISLIIKRVLFIRNAREVLGEVVSMAARYPGGLQEPALPRYVPKVQFVAENDKQYEFVDNFGSKVLSYQVGSPIPVLYDPKNPRKAFINNFFTLWPRPVLISAFGVFLIFMFL